MRLAKDYKEVELSLASLNISSAMVYQFLFILRLASPLSSFYPGLYFSGSSYMMFLLISSGQLMKNLAISSLKNYMRPMLVSSSSVNEDSQLKSEPSLSSDSNFCFEETMSCFVFSFLVFTCYSMLISISKIIKGIKFNSTCHKMLQPTTRQKSNFFPQYPPNNNQKQDFSALVKTRPYPKYIKLRPKSQMDLEQDKFFKVEQNSNQISKDQKKNHLKFHSKSFNQGNKCLEKITKRTSLQQSFIIYQSSLMEGDMSDRYFLSADLKQIDKEQTSGTSKRREAVKLKRAQKHYSPINKLIQLQALKAKGKINVISKDLINNIQ